MRAKNPFWVWRAVFGGSFVVGLAIVLLYAWLPVDGGTGDLSSLGLVGFRVQWLLEQRAGGLQPEDVIVQAGGHTAEEWLAGAPRGPEWTHGGLVAYQVLRNDEPMQLDIRLAPIPFRAILSRWALQFIVALAFVILGTFVYWQRPTEPAARVLMLFCTIMALQYLGDAYNFQYPTLPWRWPFWVQLSFEHIIFGLGIATICVFALIFPIRNPLIIRFPRLVPAALYLSYPTAVLLTMAASGTWTAAIRNGNYAAWLVAFLQICVAIGAGIYSARTARDPVTRAQIQWIIWCTALGCAVLLPGYVLPLLITGRPLLPHPVSMLVIALIPLTFAIAVLRYRLFAIDIIINRTLVYGTLTVLLAVLYMAVVRLLTWAVEIFAPAGNSSLVFFVSTLAIALAFAPLRARIQDIIDRTFYRAKLDFRRLVPELGEKLAVSLSLEQVGEVLIGELPERLQIDGATITTLGPEGELTSLSSQGRNFPDLTVDHPLVEFAHQSGHPLGRLLPPPGLPASAQDLLDQQGIELCIPLHAGTEYVGLYCLGPKLSGHAYSGEEMRHLHLLGQQAAVSIENSRLFQAERSQRQLAQALQQAAEIVSSTLDLDQVMDRILEQVERVVDGDATNFMLVEGNKARIVRWRGYKELDAKGDVAHTALPIDEYPNLKRMQQTGQPIFIPDTTVEPDWVAKTDWEWLRSYVSAPIQVAGQTVGFLNVDGTRPGQFGPADEQRLAAFAHHAAAAFENAELYERAQQEIAERTLVEERLRESLADKEILLKEIHHRVKNNLQVISSLLHVQSRYIQDPETLEMFEDSRHRVRSMAMVHEKLYQAEDLANVDFGKYVRSLASYLIRSYSQISGPVGLDIQVTDVSLGVDTAIPCGLILNELISNSLKHAFPNDRTGTISIGFARGPDGRFTLSIQDNGVGVPDGFDFKSTDSLGMQIVNTLVEQLEGTIELDRTRGTHFIIQFSQQAQDGKEQAS